MDDFDWVKPGQIVECLFVAYKTKKGYALNPAWSGGARVKGRDVKYYRGIITGLQRVKGVFAVHFETPGFFDPYYWLIPLSDDVKLLYDRPGYLRPVKPAFWAKAKEASELVAKWPRWKQNGSAIKWPGLESEAKKGKEENHE